MSWDLVLDFAEDESEITITQISRCLYKAKLDLEYAKEMMDLVKNKRGTFSNSVYVEACSVHRDVYRLVASLGIMLEHKQLVDDYDAKGEEEGYKCKREGWFQGGGNKAAKKYRKAQKSK